MTLDHAANVAHIQSLRQNYRLPSGRNDSRFYNGLLRAFALGVPLDFLPQATDVAVLVGIDQFLADAAAVAAGGWQFDDPPATVERISMPPERVSDFRASLTATLDARNEKQAGFLAHFLRAFPAVS